MTDHSDTSKASARDVLAALECEEGHTWETACTIAEGQIAALAAAGMVTADKPVLQMALMVLCAARDRGDWDARFIGDMGNVIDALRTTLGIPPAPPTTGETP